MSNYARELARLCYPRNVNRDLVAAVPVEESSASFSLAPTIDNGVLETQVGTLEVTPYAVYIRTLSYANSVCRVVARTAMVHPHAGRIAEGHNLGTAILVGPDVVITCSHVVPNVEVASKVRLEFRYFKNPRGVIDLDEYELASDETGPTILADEELDFVLLRIDGSRVPDPMQYVSYPLANSLRDENTLYGFQPTLLLMHYPGESQLSLSHYARLLQLEASTAEFRHDGDTAPGSSGAPIFSQYGFLIGIHRKRGPLDPADPTGRRSLYNVAMRIDRILSFIQSEGSADLTAALSLAP